MVKELYKYQTKNCSPNCKKKITAYYLDIFLFVGLSFCRRRATTEFQTWENYFNIFIYFEVIKQFDYLT